MSGKREFSLSNFVDSVMDVISNGFSSIVNNIMEPDAENDKAVASRVSYKGYQLFRIHPLTQKHTNEITEVLDNYPDDIQFWTHPFGNKSIDIIVAPNVIQDVKDYLKENKIEFKVLMPDLQRMINRQNPKVSKEQRDSFVSTQGHPMSWKRYCRYGEIIKFLDHIKASHPSMVEIVTIGYSYEGLPLKVVKISTGLDKLKNTKPTVWIDAGMHAREWIGTAVATYIINQLVKKNSSHVKLLDTVDWMILPIVNPDGYEFTHTNDRLWRKTRSNYDDDSEESSRYTPTGLFYFVYHHIKSLWSRCDGVDPNRNFDYHWGQNEKRRGGASSNPCHETYKGPYAFSEPETKAMADYIMANRDKIKLYLTLHSYNQMWLVPWGHTYEKPADYADLVSMAKKATKTISKVYGTKYKVGSSADLLYPTTGASDDWAKGVAGIKYSYTVELRDRGDYGFLLPAAQILPTARETWAGIRAIARLVAAKT
ncbi:carboxypeptidase B-like [Chelonus insularis]|uniref:carboxypeptidase B-like n=1 Tax=Chelonus insularis TaxID=460826 RepID=UPI0015897181|nr:carboxypeptidase B-like [Chelonus insularis]